MLFDPATIDAGEVHMVQRPAQRGRPPGGRGQGVSKVFVNGRLTVDANVPTGVLAGTLLKSGRDTDTVLPV